MVSKFNYYILTALLVFICQRLQAQPANPQYDPKSSVPILGMDFSLLGKMSTKIEEDEGFPENEQYENFLYKQGQLFNQKNEMIGEYLMRYNVYRDEMEANKPSSPTKIIFYKDQLGKVTLEKVDYHVLEYVHENGNLVKGYFTSPIFNSNCSIFIKHEKKLKKGKPAKDSYHEDTKTTVVSTKKYFLRFSDGKLQPISLNKNKILKTFPKFQDEVQDFIKENKLKMKTEEDLVTLVKFYNHQLAS